MKKNKQKLILPFIRFETHSYIVAHRFPLSSHHKVVFHDPAIESTFADDKPYSSVWQMFNPKPDCMNKIKLFAVFVFANVFSISLSSQTFHDIFGVHGSSRSDKAVCARQSSDGGFVMLGVEFYNGSGLGDILFLKTDGAGDTLWSHVYSGSNDDKAACFQLTADGGYIIIGSTQSIGMGNYDYYLIKTDANGDTLWTRTYGGTGNDYGHYVQVTNDGGYVMYGESDVNSGINAGEGYLVKTDNAGNLQWAKTYGTIGGDYGYTARQTSDNGYIMQMSVFDFNIGDWDELLVRTDVNGDTLWTKKYDTPNSETSGGIVQTADGGFLFAAVTTGAGAGGQDILLVKTNTLGDTMFVKTIGGISDEVPYSIEPTSDGGYIICGESWSYSTYNSVYLVKLDANINVEWSTTMSGIAYRYGTFASQNSDGGYIIAGSTSDWGIAGQDYDAYLIRTNAGGYGYCADLMVNDIVGHRQVTVSHTPITVGSGGVMLSTQLPCYRNCVFEQHCASPLAIETKSTNEFSLSPNPSDGKIHIVADHVIDNCSVQLYNVLGEKISEEKISDFNSGDFDFSGNDTGIYFVMISGGEKIFTAKLILQ
jgi:hypothetical protein